MLYAKNARTATTTAKSAVACAIAAALALSPIAAFAAPAPAALQSRTSVTQSAYIGAEQAKSIALKDAGFTENQCRCLDVDLDTDDGPVHYDVDFKVGNREYEYDINALTGDIMSRDIDIDD